MTILVFLLLTFLIFLSGNVPTSQSYGVFISQLIRYARCCQKFVDFKERTSALVRRLIKQNFKLSTLRPTFNKFSSKYSHLLRKYKEFRIYDLSVLLQSKEMGERSQQVCSKTTPGTESPI